MKKIRFNATIRLAVAANEYSQQCHHQRLSATAKG